MCGRGVFAQAPPRAVIAIDPTVGIGMLETARFLVRAGQFENPESGSRARNAVIEFPTYKAVIDCWHSPEYQEVLKLRLPVSTADLIIIIEGNDGPQP